MKFGLAVLVLFSLCCGSALAGGTASKVLASVKSKEDADAPPKKPENDDTHSKKLRSEPLGTGIQWDLIANKLQFIGTGYFPIEFDNQQRRQLLEDVSMPLVRRKKTTPTAKVTPAKKKPTPVVVEEEIEAEEDSPVSEDVSDESVVDCLTKHYNAEARTDYKHYLSHKNFEMSMNLKGEGKFIPNVDVKMGGKAGVGANVYAATLRRSWNHEVNLFTVYIDPKCYGKLSTPFKRKLEEMKELVFDERTAPRFYRFFYEFGTHFSNGAQVGGMVSIEESEAIKGYEFSQELAATASNEAMTVELGDKLKTNKFKSARHASVHVVGGASQDVMVQVAETSLQKNEVTHEYMAELKKWQISITPETAVVTSYSLTSILELVDEESYPGLKREMKKAWDKYAQLVQEHARKIEFMRPIGALLRKYARKIERNPWWIVRVFVKHLRRDVVKKKLLFNVLSGFCHVYGCEAPKISAALDLNNKMQLAESHFRTMLANFEEDLETGRNLLQQAFKVGIVRYRDVIPQTGKVATTYEWVDKNVKGKGLIMQLTHKTMVEQIQKRWSEHDDGRTLYNVPDEFQPENLAELDPDSLSFKPRALVLIAPSKIDTVVASEIEPEVEPSPESESAVGVRVSDHVKAPSTKITPKTKATQSGVTVVDEED